MGQATGSAHAHARPAGRQRQTTLCFAALAVAVLALAATQPVQAGRDVQQSAARQADVVIALAPTAPLINGLDDVDVTGNCAKEVAAFCADITPGEGRVAECLSDQITASEVASDAQQPDASGDKAGIQDACREEVYQYKITRSRNVNFNVPLARACKVDAERLCNSSWMVGYKAGAVIACLRELRDKLAPGCRKEVFQVQLAAAQDFRADPQLYEACKADADALCKDVKPGGGRVQACLRDKPLELAPECLDQLFRQEQENADDVRLSVRLYEICLPDKRKFCKDVSPGAARVKDCLEEHRGETGFSAECKAEIEAMIERRSQNFRLDSRLSEVCADDIRRTCAIYGDSTEVGDRAGSVVKCLQDFSEEIQSETCRQQVKKYKVLASQDIRFDVPLAAACYADRQSFCGHVPPGSARVIRCLRNTREKLSSTCRAALFDEEVTFSENIDFQAPMRKACSAELKLFCEDIPHGEARVIRCLQDHKSHKDFGKECKDEVQQFESEAASDYRLNHRLAKACKDDVSTLCALACSATKGQTCGGKVLRCLTENRELLQSEACRREVFYFEKMEVTDYRNDVILAAACQSDVAKLCKDIEPGEGRVHECLRAHRANLTAECRREELLLEELEAENVELRPGVMRMCKDERGTFCKGVVPGGARMFRCLAEKMGDVDFGEACRAEVTKKLQRRQANWKLDPPLRKACKANVASYCSSQDSMAQERALVYKCLISNYDDLDAGCQKELGRALHMAFFIWQPGQLLTGECDDNVRAQCLAQRPNMDKTPGAVGQCLATIAEEMEGPAADPVGSAQGGPSNAPRRLVDACRLLTDISQPPDLKKAFDASLSVAVLQSQLKAMEGLTGLEMVRTDRLGNARGITLTGWSALAGVAALVLVIIWGTGFAWSRFSGGVKRDLTLVLKKGHQR